MRNNPTRRSFVTQLTAGAAVLSSAPYLLAQDKKAYRD